MTDHKTLTAGGVPVHQILMTGLTEMVDQVLGQVVAEIPLYAQLPREELQGDIRRITERTLRAFAETFRTGVVPVGPALDPLRESAARRAEEGVPLEALLAAYHLGGKVCADFVAARFRPEELADALELNRLILDFLQSVTATVAASYFEERQTIAGEDQASRQTLLSTLLDGGPAADTARRAGLRLPAAYAVLGLALGAHADELQPGVDAKIVARRKLRRIRVELDRAPGGPAMATLSAEDGIALLAVPALDAERPRGGAEGLRGAVEGSRGAADVLGVAMEVVRAGMSKAAGVEVMMSVAEAAPEDVPAAVSLVRELLDVVRIHQLPAAVYRLDDLMLEYQLSRPSPARDRLALLLEPLAEKPDLLSTLRSYLGNGRNRRQTATDLHVHANTVDYRLRQVGRLTGLDPAHADQLPRLVAALAAYDAS